MSPTTRLGLMALAGSFSLGVLGDALLRVGPWGINLGLWVAGIVVLAVALARDSGEFKGNYGFLGLAVLFAGGLAWRDSMVLSTLNGLFALTALSLAPLQTRAGRLWLASITDYVSSGALTTLRTSLGPMFLLIDLEWKEIPTAGWLRHVLSAFWGLALATPLLIVFGTLLVSADAAFERVMKTAFDWDIVTFISHVAMTVSCGWIGAGLLVHLLPDTHPKPKEEADPAPPTLTGSWLGITETAIPLALLDALFLAFVVVQSRYFFGGAAVVESSDSLTYSEYARRGFFELVAVATLVLPLLLFADWSLDKKGRADTLLFRGLAGPLVVLVFIMMASAVQRMLIYHEQYGLTELRFYTTVFMGWLGVVFVWFVATVLGGRRERFAFGMLASAIMFVVGLNAVNPDAFIVQTNVGHARFDAYYNATLSADAVPTLIASLPAMPPGDASLAAQCTLNRWSPPSDTDWRSWNAARTTAWQAVAANETHLRDIQPSHACPRSSYVLGSPPRG